MRAGCLSVDDCQAGWCGSAAGCRHGCGLQLVNEPNAFEHVYSFPVPVTVSVTLVMVIPVQGAEASHVNFPGELTVPDTLMMRTLL